MPCRKKPRPRPNFSFVTVVSNPASASWLKTHSSAARSHAAYWGGSAKHQRDGNTPIVSSNTDQDSSSSQDYDPTIQRQRSPPITHPLCSIQQENLQHLPAAHSVIRAIDS